MSAQPPSAIELEFARRYNQEHARVCLEPRPRGVAGRLGLWRDEQRVRRALKMAGEPGLILDVACGIGRFWPVLAEHSNRVILASDPSQDMLNHAQTHHSPDLLKRIKTFQSSAFTIELPANAVDCIFCMELFQHIATSEHRLAMLEEFHRVSRDTVIVALRVEPRFKFLRSGLRSAADPSLVNRADVEAEFKRAGFCLLSHQDFLPGCGQMRVYVLRKAG
ncbi:class I SAM-dependent methyltransferase [Pseudomonas sp. PB120]|uniref:class I SAM-dependent methyltransferase n=1 Tax=Pseudomonas sp. PB120 TaxID=2494700 RepID=UPI0012FDE33D|nr:class I SAM-dependent methyltransferase [Pseudomonas sp. PB120]MVV49616.1 class I SAM-dependent methyltransferase [Pseudomonas sp. PB120]